MHITFLGHACFLLNDGQHRILIDPFLTGNPLAPVSADEVDADYILITHGHGDHFPAVQADLDIQIIPEVYGFPLDPFDHSTTTRR